ESLGPRVFRLLASGIAPEPARHVGLSDPPRRARVVSDLTARRFRGAGRSGSMHPRTRLMLAAVVIAAIATPAGLACAWHGVHRPGGGNPNNPAVQLGPVQTGLAWPIALAFASDGRIFFAERNTGNIRIIDAGGSLLPTPFYTLTNTATAGERGFLGLALDPGFP